MRLSLDAMTLACVYKRAYDTLELVLMLAGLSSSLRARLNGWRTFSPAVDRFDRQRRQPLLAASRRSGIPVLALEDLRNGLDASLQSLAA